MKRYLIADLIGTGAGLDPIRPDMPAGSAWVVVANQGGKALVKTVVPAGAAKTAPVMADMDTDGLDAVATPLTLAQRSTIRDWLAAQGIDVSDFDSAGVSDRRKLLLYVARRMGIAVGDLPLVLSGFDVRET